MNIQQEREDQLREEVAAFARDLRRQWRRASRINSAVVALGLLASFGITFLGLGGAGELAALLGAFVAMLIGFDRAFAYGEKADFYRILLADGENLLTALRLDVHADMDFEEVVRRFLVLRKYAAEKLPRGTRMKAVRNMSRELISTSARR